MTDADPARWARLRALFDAALDLAPEARAGFLERETVADPVLREELQRLLAEELRAERLMDDPALSHVPPWTAEDLTGREAGGYVFEGLLGRGGMGVVHRARQRAPRRTVAVKTLSSPLSSSTELNRFRLEVEVLGALQHRAIAQVYDAGALSLDGRSVPFVALELVEGALDIVRYADARSLGSEERVALVREACEGVHHAHRRGIVHRDLKPGNLLVDTTGQVKVIDFGLARVADSRALGVSTVETLAGSVLGTLEYMSPEHVGGQPQEIDVRSDIFSLGCVLFELLAGRPPRDLRNLSIAAAIQRIANEDVLAPQGLARPLRAILARALARRPDDRYGSAAELAAELQRYERGETVHALRGHRWATVTGFSRRHRAVLLGLVAVILALAMGLFTTERARRSAVRAEAATRAEADTSLEIATALGSVISSVQPFANGREARVLDVLRDLEGSLPYIQDRRARAAVGSVLGQGLINLREFERAAPILETAVRDLSDLEPADSPRRLLAVAALADHLEQTGEYTRSLELSRPAYVAARIRLGADNYTTRYLGTNTAVCAVRLGRYAEARDLYREFVADALAQTERNHQFEVATLERLAQVLLTMGAPEEAQLELARAQEILEATGGGRSLFAVALKSTRAQIEGALGNGALALALHQEALTAYEARSDSGGNAFVSAINVAAQLMHLGRTAEATALLTERSARFAAVEPTPGRYHSHLWVLEAQLACRRGDGPAAIDHARRALALGAELAPTGWPDDHHARRSLAYGLLLTGEPGAALTALREGLPTAAVIYGPESEEFKQLGWRELHVLGVLGRGTEAAELATTRGAAWTRGPEPWSDLAARAAHAFDADAGR